MKLAAADIAQFHGGSEFLAVFCRGNEAVAASVSVEGVDKLYAVLFFHIPEQPAVTGLVQGVPADVGDFKFFRN